MIHWVYEEEKTGDVKETGGNFRKHLLEVRERKRNRKKRMIFYGIGVTVTGLAVLSLIYFRNPLYEKFSMEYSIEQQKTEAVSAEPLEQVLSEAVVVEELSGQVSQLPLTKTPESATPTPIPTAMPTPAPEEKEEATQETVAEPAEEATEYVVQPGDTIASISREHYGSMEMVKKICERNEIINGDYIQAGEIIVLP